MRGGQLVRKPELRRPRGAAKQEHANPASDDAEETATFHGKHSFKIYGDFHFDAEGMRGKAQLTPGKPFADYPRVRQYL